MVRVKSYNTITETPPTHQASLTASPGGPGFESLQQKLAEELHGLRALRLGTQHRVRVAAACREDQKMRGMGRISLRTLCRPCVSSQ